MFWWLPWRKKKERDNCSLFFRLTEVSTSQHFLQVFQLLALCPSSMHTINLVYEIHCTLIHNKHHLLVKITRKSNTFYIVLTCMVILVLQFFSCFQLWQNLQIQYPAIYNRSSGKVVIYNTCVTIFNRRERERERAQNLPHEDSVHGNICGGWNENLPGVGQPWGVASIHFKHSH